MFVHVFRRARVEDHICVRDGEMPVEITVDTVGVRGFFIYYLITTGKG